MMKARAEVTCAGIVWAMSKETKARIRHRAASALLSRGGLRL